MEKKKNKKNAKTEEKQTLLQKTLEQSKKLLINVFSLLLAIIGILYALIWGILFLVYTETKGSYPSSCKVLKNWDRALYIALLLAGLLSISCTIYPFAAKGTEGAGYRYLVTVKNLVSFVANFVFLIAITVVYFTGDQYRECKPLKTLTLIYIIFEWALIGIVCLFIIFMVAITLTRKKYQKSHYDYDKFSDDETPL